jgi:tetratricopeptide (TPR) repeat protein
MSDHPSSQDLHLFLRGELLPGATRRVISHLLKGCVSCCAALAPRAEVLLSASFGAPGVFGEGTGRPVDSLAFGDLSELDWLDPELDAAYDAAFDRALAKARELAPSAAAAFSASPRSELSVPTAALPADLAHLETVETASEGIGAVSAGLDLAGCEALLERCRLLRHDDATQLLELAGRAVECSERLRPERHGAAKVAELQAYSWSEQANAHRLAGDLRQAEVAIAHAFDRAAEAHACAVREGASDQALLLAHLYDLQASLYADQRRLDEALRLQDLVYEIRMERGDLHGAGRALISKGVYTGFANDSEGALRLLAEGRQMIDAERDPQLVLLGIHNTASLLVEAGRFREAAELVRANRALFQENAGRADRLRLLMLSGEIKAGLGELAAAEQELREAKRGLERLGFGYRSALTTLYLCRVCLRQGRAAEARELAEEAVAVFSGLGVGHEALGALMLLQRSFELSQATVVIDRVADFMRRAATEPAARFEPVRLN